MTEPPASGIKKGWFSRPNVELTFEDLCVKLEEKEKLLEQISKCVQEERYQDLTHILEKPSLLNMLTPRKFSEGGTSPRSNNKSEPY